MVVILCLGIFIIVILTFMFSHSQALQRFGILECLLGIALGVSALFGYTQAQRVAEEQYLSLFSVNYGDAYSYIRELENAGEEENLSEERFAEIFPVTERESDQYRYLNVAVLKRQESGNYEEIFSEGRDASFWKRVSENGVALIDEALNTKKTVYQYLDEESALLILTDWEKIAPQYALAAEVSLVPVIVKMDGMRYQYLVNSLIILLIGTLLLAVVIFMQEREVRRVVKFISRVAEGKDDWNQLEKIENKKLGIESNEMRSLYNGLRQIASDTERMNYMKYMALQAYYRFAPKEIEKILNKQSILDVAPSDRVHIEGTLAFVSFSISEKLNEQEYVTQMNRNYSLLGEIRKEHDGIILAGNSELNTLKLMFKDETIKALHFGIETVTREVDMQQWVQAFVLLHRTAFIYGVVGNEEQAFSYIHSKEMNILEKYVDMLRDMGVRMAVTDYVYELVEHETEARYIGFVMDGNYSFKIYEILDAYPSKERLCRIDLKPKFQKAMNLFYQSDFYLARNTFSEVLKECPSDEVAKWYLFLCEKYLNSESKEKPSFALFDER